MSKSFLDYAKDDLNVLYASHTMSNKYDYKLSQSSKLAINLFYAVTKLTVGLSTKMKVSCDVTFTYSNPMDFFEKKKDFYKKVASSTAINYSLYGLDCVYHAQGEVNLAAAYNFTFISKHQSSNTFGVVAASVAGTLASLGPIAAQMIKGEDKKVGISVASVAAIAAIATMATTLIKSYKVSEFNSVGNANNTIDVRDPKAAIAMIAMDNIDIKSNSKVHIKSSRDNHNSEIVMDDSSIKLNTNDVVEFKVGDKSLVKLDSTNKCITVNYDNQSKIVISSNSVKIQKSNNTCEILQNQINFNVGASSLKISTKSFKYSPLELDGDKYKIG